MARYYFHIADKADLIIDDEGLELPNRDAARAEAEMCALDYAAQCLREGKPADGRRIIVQDHHGKTLMECGIKDVVARLAH